MGTRRRSGRALLATAVVGCLVLVACQPLRLGGPGHTWGNDPTNGAGQAGFWAAVTGPYTNRSDGDPFATKCSGDAGSSTSCAGGGANASYDPSGNLYSINVPVPDVGVPVTVQVYDPALGPTTAMGESEAFAPFSTSFELFAPSGAFGVYALDPAHSMATLGACGAGTPGSKVFSPGTGADQSTGAWYSLCTFTPTTPGEYALRARASQIPGVADQGGGVNLFSIRAEAATQVQPQVYPIYRSSTLVPASGPDQRLYLGNFDVRYAGRTLIVDLFDAGDGSAGALPLQMQFLAPPGGAPAVVPTGGTPIGCTYNATGSLNLGPPTPDASPTCTITTTAANSSTGIYDNRWLRVRVAIPADYTCAGDCWWTMAYHLGGGSLTDRLVLIVAVSAPPP